MKHLNDIEADRLNRVPDLENVTLPDKYETLTVAHLRGNHGWIMLEIFSDQTFRIRNTTLPLGRQPLSTLDEMQFPALREWALSVVNSLLVITSDNEEDEISEKPEN
jgi:hypothetical protein